jgi:phenylacetic acid degradation protein PaaD
MEGLFDSITMTDFYKRVVTDPYANFLGIRFDRVEPGFASCSLIVTASMFNFLNVVHGGLVFSLADAAFSAASNRDHSPSFALDVSGTFLRTAKIGDVLRAEAQLVHATRRTALYRMTVLNGEELVSTFNGTVYKAKERSALSEPALEPEPESSWTEPLSGMTFLFIPGGSFMMGDFSGKGHENETPVHEVTLTPFFMARTPVTRQQWLAVTGEDAGPCDLSPDHPVTHVSFNDIETFIGILNEKHQDRSFCFPTEAQWEYAARSGAKDQIFAGSDNPKDVAWFGENSDGRPHRVATKKPNGFGLFDMSGNVWEWCLDHFDEAAYEKHERQDPVTKGKKGEDRAARGGSWLMDAWSARCTRRFSFPEDVSGNGLGFRPVMVPCSQR